MDAYFDALRELVQPIRAADLPQTLEPMRHLLDRLGSPHERFTPIVVAGSTGKGTTCRDLAALLGGAGIKTGLYTSPHLHLFRERFVVDGEMIEQAALVEAWRVVRAAEQHVDHRFSTFESGTALALWWFAQQPVDVAVLEIGLGGRFDAVNIVANRLALLTPIELEHAAMLGGTLETIAWHKAGIIQPGGTAISAPQVDAVRAVLEREAGSQGARLIFEEGHLARAAYHLLAREKRLESLPADPIAVPIALPGRREIIDRNGREIVIDGGHTPEAARALRQFTGDRSALVIVGMLRDKAVEPFVRVFDTPENQLVGTQPPADRALRPDELLGRFQPQHARWTIAPSLEAALDSALTADQPLVIITGSLRLAAAAREHFGMLSAEELAEAQATRAIFDGESYRRKLE